MSPRDAIPEYLQSLTFVAFDTETTGLWAASHRIVELAGVRFRIGESGVDTFQSLVNPERRIPDEVTRIHGITDETVADAPLAAPVLRDFIEFCGTDSVLVAHNAPFDISFVGSELERAGLAFDKNLIIDTVDIYHRFFPGLVSYSLLSLVRAMGIAASQEHRALADAKQVMELIRHAASKMTAIDSEMALRGTLTVSRMSDWQGREERLPEQYSSLERALTDRLAVRIVYQTPAQPVSRRTVRPLAFYALGSRFYMNAYCELAQGERTFRLDRIATYELVEE